MKYATWKLNFTDPSYGTGPETFIVEQGGSAEGAFSAGDVAQGAKILGFFTGQATGLDAWDFTEVTQQEALEFVLAMDETAFVDEDGKIAVIISEQGGWAPIVSEE
jgi:hypothetical protein